MNAKKRKNTKRITYDGTFFKELKERKHGAYRKLYDDFGKKIYKYIRSFFPFDSSRADDMMQEVFITAYNKIDTLKDINKIQPWLYKIAFGKCIDFKRKNEREKKHINGMQNIYDNGYTLEDKIIDKHILEFVNNEIDKMPGELKNVLVLKHYQGLTLNTISEITNFSVPKIRRLLERAGMLLLHNLKAKNIDKGILK